MMKIVHGHFLIVLNSLEKNKNFKEVISGFAQNVNNIRKHLNS
jgi:hypothetical protein